MKRPTDTEIKEQARPHFVEALKGYDHSTLRAKVDQQKIYLGIIHKMESDFAEVVVYEPGATDADPFTDYGSILIDSRTGACHGVAIFNLPLLSEEEA